jgi:molybdate transport system substrate-binding protein
MKFPLLAVAVLTITGCANLEKPAPVAVLAAAPVQVFAAGSLRGAMTAIAKDYEAQTGQKIALTFDASGLLREQIEKGAAAQVFASADTDHPQRLAKQGG